MLDQERAGVDVISTGEMMRVRFIIGFYDRITRDPRAAAAAAARPAALGHQHAVRGRGEDRGAAGAGHRRRVPPRRAASPASRSRPPCPAPTRCSCRSSLAAPIATRTRCSPTSSAIVNAECRALVAAGADFIQIDEPHHGMYAGTVHDVTKGINRAVEGVDAKIAVHVCFGNLYGRPSAPCATTATCFRRSAICGLADRARVRQRGDGGPRALEGLPARQGAGRRRHRRQGLQGGDGRGRGRAHPRVPAATSRPSGCG